jgi:hypothetical protein
LGRNKKEEMHWIVRCGIGTNFINSRSWSVNSKNMNGRMFLANYKKGDLLWFLTNFKGGRKLIGVATIFSVVDRIIGPLVSQTNAEIGWTEGEWGDKQLHYENCFTIESLNLKPDIKCMSSFIKYNQEKFKIDLSQEYANIIKYSEIRKKL